MTAPESRKNVFLLGASADIGAALAERFRRDGCDVVGTSRRGGEGDGGLRLLACDVGDPASVQRAATEYGRLGLPWDLWISCVGTMEPIGPFFETEFASWERSVQINSLGQLRALHATYPYRRRGGSCDAVFLAGGGTNGPFTNYSAYCSAKILLIKMCELIDDEAPDLNTFIVGPGWVRTRIHQETLKNSGAAGGNFRRTEEFLKSDSPGTSMDDIYACIRWCADQGRDVAGGRNFSVVHDPWREGGAPLAGRLRGDRDAFRLRRSPGGK
jgi:NAD(P)-dependent dehydrogenase (short-subunit alcohol dehydrogenase family)